MLFYLRCSWKLFLSMILSRIGWIHNGSANHALEASWSSVNGLFFYAMLGKKLTWCLKFKLFLLASFLKTVL